MPTLIEHPGSLQPVTETPSHIALALLDACGADAPATLRTYRIAAKAFATWASAHGLAICYPYNPRDVAAFLDTYMVTRERQAPVRPKPATLRTYLAAINRAHRDLDLPAPGDAAVVRLAVKRMSRAAAAQGVRTRQAAPLRAERIGAAVARAGTDLAALRDTALMWTAYDTLARAAELVALDVRDLEPEACTIWRSKVDQEGHGDVRFISPDTWAHVRAWITAAGLRPADPLFKPLGPAASEPRLSTRDVARIIKRRAGAAFSAHSTRVGAAVEQREAGVTTGQIAQAGGWKGDAMVARYTRAAGARESGSAILARRQGRA